jgi:CheY-like chemotaxis protein
MSWLTYTTALRTTHDHVRENPDFAQAFSLQTIRQAYTIFGIHPIFTKELQHVEFGRYPARRKEDLIRAIITETLGEEGYTLRSASDWTAMHLALAAQLPNIVICDIDLDHGPSPGLIDDMRAIHGAAMPLVFLTTNLWTARSLAEQGLTCYLLKPFDLNDLLTSVATHIRSHDPSAAAPLGG